MTRKKRAFSSSFMVDFLLYGLRSTWPLRLSRYSRHSRSTLVAITTPLIFFLLLLPIAAAAVPIGPGGIGKESGEQLLARCEPALRSIEASDGVVLSEAERLVAESCIGFVDGFIWGHAWSAWRKRTDMFFCPPESFSAREGIPALVNYLRAHPDRLIQRAHLLLFAAFNSAYPCQP